ncbi:MAG: peptidylprolyl isomerase [Burkholderiales bacterium]|nr:peptidylprolyl isomerase [Burkholderiales bacterium]
MPGLAAAALLALAAPPVSAQTQFQGQVPRPGQSAQDPSRPREASRIVLVDRIVAVVGNEVVTRSELVERRNFAERQLRRQGTPLPERSQLERQILDRLIIDKAQLQLARDSGIRIEELQLDKALERIAENNNVSLAGFRQMLTKDGVPYERFREEVRQQIQMQRLREREVDDRVEVTDAEIDQFLAEAKSDGRARNEYNLAHVLVRLPEQASPEQIETARKKIERARAEAVAGADFAKVAAGYSDAPDALQGGAMGWRPEDRLPELFAKAVQGMKAGEVSGVLRSPGGFHIVKLVDRRGAAEGPPVQQTRARHILIRTNELTSEAEAQRRLADLRERIVTGGADFAELARLHSADGSAARGGDLGWLLPGDTVPDFERAMDALKINEISRPVKSPFGYHLIQVQERRAAGLSEERRRMQARQTIKERKAEEAYQEWLRQLRDRTYVELRLDDK